MIEFILNLSGMSALSGVVIIPMCVAYLLVTKFDKNMKFFHFCNRIFNVKEDTF